MGKGQRRRTARGQTCGSAGNSSSTVLRDVRDALQVVVEGVIALQQRESRERMQIRLEAFSNERWRADLGRRRARKVFGAAGVPSPASATRFRARAREQKPFAVPRALTAYYQALTPPGRRAPAAPRVSRASPTTGITADDTAKPQELSRRKDKPKKEKRSGNHWKLVRRIGQLANLQASTVERLAEKNTGPADSGAPGPMGNGNAVPVGTGGNVPSLGPVGNGVVMSEPAESVFVVGHGAPALLSSSAAAV